MGPETDAIPANREALLALLGLKKKRCVEVGVFQGDFAAKILEQGPAFLLLVDPYQHNPGYVDILNKSQAEFEEIFRTTRERFGGDPRVHFCRSTSATAVREITALVDYVNIDARHEFAYVLADLCFWFPLVRPGGWITCHDYGGADNPFKGVRLAVDAFCEIAGQQVAFETRETHWTSAVIQVRRAK